MVTLLPAGRVAFDFDTFLFEDPRHHLETLAEAKQLDILVARHLDADCLNMGPFLSKRGPSLASSLCWCHLLPRLSLHPFFRPNGGVVHEVGCGLVAV